MFAYDDLVLYHPREPVISGAVQCLENPYGTTPVTIKCLAPRSFGTILFWKILHVHNSVRWT